MDAQRIEALMDLSPIYGDPDEDRDEHGWEEPAEFDPQRKGRDARASDAA